MNLVDEKIREYGQKRDIDALKKTVMELEDDELLNLVKTKVDCFNFTSTWNYLLQSFTDNADSHRRRYEMVKCALKEIEEKDVPASRSSTIVNRLCIELTKFKTGHLAELCSFCLECIQSKKSNHLEWKDLLPELLNIISERETFEYNDMEYTGIEYKTDFINTLCLTPWSPNIITPLAEMFTEMPLTKEEHLKVTNKFGTYLEKLTPQEIPSFVYQMLKLCKQNNGRSIFLRLQSYFGLRIYSNSTLNNESSAEFSSIDLNAIESTSNQDTIDAESTVLYHIHAAASLGHECIKDYLNSLKNLLKSPELVLHPFQLMVLFTISTISHYEETVFEIVRPCIVRSYFEEQKKRNSYWVREMVPTATKPEEIFRQVINFSLQDRDLVVTALVNFGFVLLGIGSGLGRDPIAEKQWTLGTMILLKIIKRKRNVASVIIQMLCNHIITRHNSPQYIECLYILSKTLPLSMLENQSCIVELMESLVQLPGSVANQLLDALIPLTKVSPTIRDHLIILLRKALYSRVTETRQMAVNGFLKLLINTKISNLAALSQSSSSTGSFSSGHSVFTQISMSQTMTSSNTFSNEALCLEILSILRRCFMQQEEVKAQLYEGLYDAVSMNPELGIPVLDLIWFHFNEFYMMDDESLPPLNFNKIAVVRELESILTEPLGKLINAVGLVVIKVSESEEDRENTTVIKFKNILESLCERMSKCELVHFELDDGTDLLDILPESQHKVHVLTEAMRVYETLIGYKISSWTRESENHAQMINSLFQGYNRLLHFTKTLAKPKKGTKKKADVNKTTQPTQASTSNLKKDGHKSTKQIKIPKTVLSFQTIKKALNLLHMPSVDWAVAAQANMIKTKCALHQHIMQATIDLVQSVKRHKDIETKYKKMYYDHISDIAVILYSRIIKRLSDFIDFDCVTAILGMDCFHAILILINTHYKSNLKSFLNTVAEEKDDGLVAQLTQFIKTYQKIFEMDEEEISNDPEVKRLSLTTANTLIVLADFIPSDSNPLSIQLCEWLKNFTYNNTLRSKVSTIFANLLFDTHIKYKSSLMLFEQISLSIGGITGVINEEEQTTETFKIINEGTVIHILLSLCNSIKTILEDIDVVIARLKSEYNGLLYPGVENLEKKRENLKTKERGVCCQVCFVVNIMTNLSNLAIQPGNITEAIFKNLILLFSTLSLLTKYFNMTSSKGNLAFQGARFERLVKLGGKQLAPTVYKFILHLEESQKEVTQPTQGRKKNVNSDTLKSKILRDTRLIPKVVYEMEQFSKTVIQLTNKTKFDLAKYVGQGSVRDFRIVDLKNHLQNVEETSVPETQASQANESGGDLEIDESREENDDDEESNSSSPPPTKKSKK